MAGRVGVAIVGTGYIANYHARAARTGEATELLGVVGVDPDQVGKFAAEHEVPRSYATTAELAADGDVDAVVIATPNHLHAPQAIEQLEAGKHVLIEKPMAVHVAECELIAETAREAGCRVLVGHMWRFDREALALKARLDAGDIGRVVKTKGYGIHTNWGPAGWFARHREAGGGALIDMGVHALDTVRFLLGDPEPESVYAVVETCYGDYDVDDMSVLLVTWKGGAVSVIESGWWNPYMDGPEASTQLFGTRGYARLFPTSVTQVVDWKPKAVKLPSLPKRKEQCDQHIYDGQMAELAAAIRQDRDPVPGITHGLAVVRICQAAYPSHAEKRAVAL